MKKLLTTVLLVFIFSCSSSEDDNEAMTNIEYAMTAKIDGTDFLANNAFGYNTFSSTNIYSYYPKEDFVMLQGRENLDFSKEINIWLKKSDIAVGTYKITEQMFDGATGNVTGSHFISYGDLTNSGSENTVGGTIVITDVDTSSKIVTATFELEVLVTEYNVDSYTVNLTEGTFKYIYE